MKRNLIIIFIFVSAVICICCGSDKKDNVAPVSVILDTDFGPDYDDVGALAILHAMADSNEVNILATISSNMYPTSAVCIEVVNTYFGRADIPIGAPRNGVSNEDNWHKFRWSDSLAVNYPHKLSSTLQAQDAVQLYRRILSEQPDTSVTVISVGFFTNLAALLRSGTDNYSPLDGIQLIKKKVKRLVSMAGAFPSGREFNVFIDSTSSCVVFDKWPTPITLSGFEIGNAILTGKRLVAMDVSSSPVKEAYSMAMKQDNPEGRMSWDQTAVLVGVRGADKYFNTVKGRMTVSANGDNGWVDDPNGNHEYLTWKMNAEQVGTVIEDMMMHQPKEGAIAEK